MIRNGPSRNIQSIGFSGAGFLTCYHLGVTQCLIDHRILPASGVRTKHNHHVQSNNTLRFTGVSGGALTIAAITTGMSCSDAMNVCYDVNHQTQKLCSRSLDVLHPGFSLLDVLEGHLRRNLIESINQNYYGGEDEYMKYINSSGGLLRIGLSDRRFLVQFKRNRHHAMNDSDKEYPRNIDSRYPLKHSPSSYVYVDKYRNIDDVIASCLLSSYIPGITGPALGSKASIHKSILRASNQFNELVDNGCVKDGFTGRKLDAIRHTDNDHQSHLLNERESTEPDTTPLQKPLDDSERLNRDATTKITRYWKKLSELRDELKSRTKIYHTREIFWDGGLVNPFPSIDKDTIIVSPIAASFNYNSSITPAIEYSCSVTNDDSFDHDTKRHHEKFNQTEDNKYHTDNNVNFDGKQFLTNFLQSLNLHPHMHVHLTKDNIRTLRYIVFSTSDDSVLEKKFTQGYDNAYQYLNRRNLLLSTNRIPLRQYEDYRTLS